MPLALSSVTQVLADAGLLLERRGALPETVRDIVDDSRAAGAGSLFVAVRGTEGDGHAFLAHAAAAGAVAAIVEDPTRTSLPCLVVRDARRAAALAAAVAFEWPTHRLRVVGVTGTNGKTTTVNMLRHVLDERDAPSASIGTLGVLLGSEGRALDGGKGLTTPGPMELQRVFRSLADAGVSRVAMEVSSHSLEQRRIEGMAFNVAVFTNLTRDHLDYHGTMEAYLDAKSRLLEYLDPGGTIVVNLDELAWTALSGGKRRVAYSERVRTAEVHSEEVRFTRRGSEWVLALGDEREPVSLPLIGDFNVSNALGAAAGAWAMGFPAARIAARLSSMPQVPGRLEVVLDAPTVLRDYAHTPDALARALDAVRPFARRKLIVVFGCGGDRDRGKRPLMGAIAETRSDHAILTSDNPRTEDPERILDDIEAGMLGTNRERIEDRRGAIARALEVAHEDDVILLAGKGHEVYQIRGTTRFPFDEREIVVELAGRERGMRSTPAGER